MHFFKSRSKNLQHTCSKRGVAVVVKGRLNNVKKNALLVGVGFPNGPPSNAIHFSIQQIGEVEMSHVKILQFTPKNMSVTLNLLLLEEG